MNINGKPAPFELFKEGMVKEVLKSAADVDVDRIKDEWKDASGKGVSKTINQAKTLNDEGLQKGADELGEIDKAMRKRNRVDTRSIVARARHSVLQFPIYVSRSIPYNSAHIIAGLFERVYTTLVQTVLSQNQIVDEADVNNLVFLKQFHTNLKEATEIVIDKFYNEYYEPIDDIDSMMAESVFYAEQITPQCYAEFRWIPTQNADLISENTRLLNDPLTGFSLYFKEKSDDDKGSKRISYSNPEHTSENTNEYIPLSEDDLWNMAKDRANLTDAESKIVDMSGKEIADEYGDDKKEDKIKEKHDAEDKVRKALNELKQEIKDAGEKKGPMAGKFKYEGGKYYRYSKKGKLITKDKEKKADPVTKSVDAPMILKDSDIKKINGMLPYTIEATFRIKGASGNADRDIKFIIGIKSVMHPIHVSDLSEDLRELVTGNIKSLQKVRYKTGEISFMDYMFNIKGIKSDAAKHINYNKRWINTLKRLGEYDKMHGSMLKRPVQAITGGDVPIPNGTLVLSHTDVVSLANSTGIDLSVVSNAKRLAKTLFLIGVVVVDSSAGTMRVLFPDSDNDWDVQSLASIDAELSKTDNSQIMRELNRMVNR